MSAEAPLLVVRDLSVCSGARTLVDRISFTVAKERVALVGESGAGKSLTARALTALLPPPVVSTASELRLGSIDLLHLGSHGLRKLRGRNLALVLQEPRHALNPVLTVGRQLDEIVRLHGSYSRAERRKRIEEMLSAVGLTVQVLSAYPLELSGGTGQRVVLAMMLVNRPQLLIADEPTSALDARLRDQVLELICTLVSALGMGLLLISHDLQQVARYCDRALVMFQGRIVDECPAAQLAHSKHPYTRTLWSCRPSGKTYGTELPVLGAEAGPNL